MELLPPDELTRLYKAGQIDLETLVLETLVHITLLQGLNELQKIVLNGLLDDVKAIAEELEMERPSEASRAKLKAWDTASGRNHRPARLRRRSLSCVLSLLRRAQAEGVAGVSG